MVGPQSKQPILVAVDFSSHSAAALAWAARLARDRSVPLLVLHVVHDPASAPGYYIQQSEPELRRLEERAADLLNEFMAEQHKVCPELAQLSELQTMLAVGLPATRILEVAQKVRASQIVVGSQGRTGLSQLMLGSKAQRVAQLAPIPVTIVKAPEHGQPEA